MPFFQGVDLDSPAERASYLKIALLTILAIAIVDWLAAPNIALGFLYIFPIMLAGAFLDRAKLLWMAAGCTVLREMFAPFPLDIEAIPGTLAVMAAFSGAGLWVRELTQNRQSALSTLHQVENETRLRQQAELQLKVLVDSSPLAILIIHWNGNILSANIAAHKMLRESEGKLIGKQIDGFLPVLAKFQRKSMPIGQFRTDLEAKGNRSNGEIFLAHVWLSTFKVGTETRLSAMVADESQEMREREEAALRQLMWHSRLMMGAVAHEIRNLCAALGVVHANLMLVPGLVETEDFIAFGKLLEGLRAIAIAELRLVKEGKLAQVGLATVLEDLRILIEPTFEEMETAIVWKVPSDLPPVWAEPQGLTQVFLNLCQNSQRAMRNASTKILTLTAAAEDSKVVVRVQDTGPGIANPDQLFQPLQKGAEVTGMGLYVSHAIVRGFGGSIRYEAQDQGACFIIELVRAKNELSS